MKDSNDWTTQWVLYSPQSYLSREPGLRIAETRKRNHDFVVNLEPIDKTNGDKVLSCQERYDRQRAQLALAGSYPGEARAVDKAVRLGTLHNLWGVQAFSYVPPLPMKGVSRSFRLQRRLLGGHFLACPIKPV